MATMQILCAAFKMRFRSILLRTFPLFLLRTSRSPSMAMLLVMAMLHPGWVAGEGPGALAPAVNVNRTIPPVPLAGQIPSLSTNPSDEEIGRLRLLPQRLLPVDFESSGLTKVLDKLAGKPARLTPAEDNAVVFGTLRSLQQSSNPNETVALTAFIESNPQSRWLPAMKFELHRRQFAQGFFTQAIAGWDALWDTVKSRRDSSSVQVADDVLGQLLEANMGLSKADRLATLISEQESRPGNAVLEAKINRAKQSVWLLRHKGAQNVMCGPVALYCIINHRGQSHVPIRLNDITDDYIATGISLAQVREYGDRYGLDLMMAKRTGKEPVPTPAVMHLRAGHFSSLLEREGDNYYLEDRPMQFRGWISPAAVDEQASGYFLIPRGALPTGWQVVSEEEGRKVFGRDGLHGQQPTGGSVTRDSKTAGGPKKNPCAMPYYTFHPQTAALRVEDTPVGYAPPVGSAIMFTISYNDMDDSKPVSSPAFANVGRIWSMDWVAWVDHVAGTLYSYAQLKVHLAGGGVETSIYNSTTSQFGPNDRSFATVVRGGPNTNTYTRTLPDGTVEIYNTPDNPSAPTRVFLTQIKDPAGNTITFTYDANLRLIAVTDAIGQVTTLEYNQPGDIWKVTKVTDPFGRFAAFTYDSSANLASVTDVIGLTSSFLYGAAEFMTNLTTPYGGTSFLKVQGYNSWDRTITVTDPEGEQERVQYIEPIDLPISGPPLPSVVNVGGVNVAFRADNGRLNFRNSFYWSRQAMREAPGDVLAARNYRWYTDNNYLVTPVLEGVKEPFENRIWFNYPGQSNAFDWAGSYYPNLGGLPEKKLQMLADGTPQLTQTYYNPLGRMIKYVDPAGRTTVYSHATNLADLLEVRQMTGGTNSDRVLAFAYNSQHLPTNIVDPAAQTYQLAYNSRGQITSLTNPKGYTRSYTYDANGYLLAIDGYLSGTNDTETFTYDAYGRLYTLKDSDGFLVAFEYDALDRLTKTTYPDGTYEQYTYNRLEPVTYRDRRGRMTTFEYNSMQQLVRVRDPLNRAYIFDWCKCGSLNSMIDPMGRMTRWQYDVQGRVVSKENPDGTKVRYTYENGSSRIKRVTDEKGQFKDYEYYVDASLRRVSYPNAKILTSAVTFGYDTYYSRIISVTDDSGVTSFAYNPIGQSPALGAGRLASIDGPWSNDVITYGYDELGRIINRSINGVPMTYSYDALWRPLSITNALGAFACGFSGTSSRLATFACPNGLNSVFNYYDNIGNRRLSQIIHTVGATPISQFAQAYDAKGIVTGASRQVGAGTPFGSSFGFDVADQLVSATVTQGVSTVKSYVFEYDLAANRTLESIDGVDRRFSYNAINEVTASAPDAGGTATYEWDGARRLSAIVQGVNRTEFTYDAFGRRTRIVEKQNGTTVSDRRFLWCGWELCEERDSTGATVTKRFFGQGMQIVVGPNNGTYYYTRDHLGSVRELLDGGGAVRARYDYDPYGRRSKVSGDLDADFGFTGHYYHTVSGLYLAPFRAYDATLGRWISRDPAGETEGLNFFRYCLNNPTVWVDKLGLEIVVSAADKDGYDMAMEYLKKDPEMKKVIEHLEKSKTKYTLKTNKTDDDSFDPNTKIVNWDPCSALKTTGGGKQSPALGLGHELDHAYGWDSNQAKFNTDVGSAIADYDNGEEKRVIDGSEVSAAKTLGEDVRQDHRGTTYKVNSPTGR